LHHEEHKLRLVQEVQIVQAVETTGRAEGGPMTQPLMLCLTVSLLALNVPGCATSQPQPQSEPGQQEQAAIVIRKEEIINRIIPEDGLTFTRRTRLMEATIAVLGKGDREELANLNRLRETLRAASLEDLQKIEAEYKERLASGEG